MEIYLVGGSVRDQLLGLPVKDRDWVVVGSTTEELLSKGFQPVGKDFPVFYTRKHMKNMPLQGQSVKPSLVIEVLWFMQRLTSP